MSRFLAPIHSWLFKKINLLQELEKDILKSHIDKYEDKVINIKNESIKLYGEYIPNQPLEELIDTDNIHGWLQEKIKEVESRNSYIITRFYEIFGNDSKDLTKKAYIKQAKQCAENENNKTENPEDVYMSLNNYVLSGMPCDRANSIVEKDANYIVYNQNERIHTPNYELGKANLNYMSELNSLWVKTFIENIDNKYTYDKEEKENNTINIIKKLQA